MNPFDIAKDLSHKKKGDLVDSGNEGQYIKESYTINRFFTLFIDTVMYANEVNKNYHLDGKLQHDYYLHSVRKFNRYTDWVKKEKNKELEAIQKYFGYTPVKAKEAAKILTKKQVKYIIDFVNPK